MAIIASVLTSVVKYTEVRTQGPNGRRKLLTEMAVMAGPITVATKTLQGRFSQGQALVEFKRNPKGWLVLFAAATKMPIAA